MILTRVFCGALWLLLVRANDEGPSLMVYNGTEASPGMFPSIGALYLESENGQYASLCGATLIDSEWAVSAAHCFYNGTQAMKFRIKLIIFGDVEPYGAGQSSRQGSSFNFSVHKRYKPKTNRYDIALLHLDNPVQSTEYVAPIEISTSSHEKKTHNNCRVAGWGLKGPKLETNKLLYADVQLQDNKKCKKAYNRFFRRRTMLCAGSDTSDACEGDSGGPLYCTNKESAKSELVGIVSYGGECGPSKTGVYTRVSAFEKWINSRGKKYALTPWAWSLIAFAIIIVLVFVVVVIVKVKN